MSLAPCLTPFYFRSASVVPRVLHTLFPLLGQVFMEMVVIPWSEVLFEYIFKQPLCVLLFLLTHYPALILSSSSRTRDAPKGSLDTCLLCVLLDWNPRGQDLCDWMWYKWVPTGVCFESLVPNVAGLGGGGT